MSQYMNLEEIASPDPQNRQQCLEDQDLRLAEIQMDDADEDKAA